MQKQLYILFILVTSFTFGQSPNDFVTTWKTDNPGTSNSTYITIPTFFGETYNYDVDWNNDGTFDEFGITGGVSHDFGTAGTYTIRIQGQFPRIYFNNFGDKDKILSVDQWGTQVWTSMAKAFFGCSNLNGGNMPIPPPDLSIVTDMSYMFSYAISFNQDVGSWNTANVTNMSHMFSYADSFNQDIGSWSTANVTNMAYMFSNASVFNQNIGSWNVGNVSNMGYIFSNASSFNQPIGNWNTTNVTYMKGMFSGATSFNQDIVSWNTANVVNMMRMFRNTFSFNQSLGGWNISSLTNASNIFDGTIGLSKDNYDNLLIGWQAGTHNNNVSLGVNSNWCLGDTARTALIADGWTITDGNLDCSTVPNCTQLSTPSDGATNIAITTDLTWTAVTDATGYLLTIGTTASGTDILNNVDVGNTTTYNPTTDFAENQHYYVTVIAYNTVGNATSCTETSFTTMCNNTTPTFTQLNSVCEDYNPLADLPTSSNDTPAITGTWTMTTDNTTNKIYTFTPDANQCANSTTMTIQFDAKVTPTFTAIPAICEGDILNPLPTTSTNGINGTWSPAFDNTTTTTYTFTPNAGECATTQTLTITVNPKVTPTFTQLNSVCEDYNPLADLPTSSSNTPAITGTWAMTTNNTTNKVYTFTPDNGQCANSTTMTIQFDTKVTPIFNPVAAICEGDILNPLPTTSTNNINGTWSPTLDNATTTTYTFTPNAGECATTQTLTVTVLPISNFNLTLSNIIITDFDIEVLMNNSVILFEYSVDSGSWQTDTIFSNLANGMHTLSVRDNNGCVIKSIQFPIDALAIPKFFTPNGDGYNDTWGIIDNLGSVSSIKIIDRYGKLLKIILPNTTGWDGTYNGKELHADDYWYLIEKNDGTTVRGHFLLKR